MSYLFLDSSNGLTLGLLNDELSWVELRELETKKTSDVVHGEIIDLLSKYNLELSKLDAVIMMAGPGSYTGMRVSEGIAQVLEFEGIKVYSFHSFRIPKLLGLDELIWVYPAFKREIFKLEKGESTLLSLNEFETLRDTCGDKLATHGDSSISEYCSVNTLETLKNNPSSIFSIVVSSEFRDAPHYFRALDVEFTKSTK